MSLKERVSLVTGAARGIGREIALALAREGADVAITDIDEAGARRAAEDVGATGARTLALRTDVSDRADVRRAVDEVISKLGSIDILVNNAGITRDAPLIRMKEADWDAVLNINLGGVIHGLEAVAPHMVERGWGRIVNISSVVGQVGNIGQTNYAASKGAIIGLTRAYALRLGTTGVTVNAIAPGFIDTEMTQSLPDKVKQEFLRAIPMGRLGQPREIAEAVVFLCAGGDYVTGQVINVDGGMVMR